MHKHEPGKTRITLERVTVTTIRRGVSQPLYCEICKQLIDQNAEPLLLEAANRAGDELNSLEKQIKENKK
jgi:hypothetical protein